MPLYESTFIARQDLSKADVTKVTEQYTGILQERGGKVVKNEYWGLRSLAYKIKKNRKGHYTMLGIDAPHDAVKEMQRTMAINEDILRTITIRVDEITEEPSPAMSARSGRDDDSGEEPKRESYRDRDPAREYARERSESNFGSRAESQTQNQE